MNINHYLRDQFFINNKTEILQHPELGILLKFKYFNNFFFGKNTIPHTTCRRQLIEDGIIFIKKGIDNNFNIDYINLSKAKLYIDLVGNLVNQEHLYLLINNYKYKNLNIDNLKFNSKINSFYINFKKYLNTNKGMVNKKILKSIGKYYFKGIINNYDDTIGETLYISFEISNGNQIHFSCGFDNILMNNYINLNNPNFELVKSDFEKSIKMSSKKKFIINNLTEVTNNESFSTILYESKEKESSSKRGLLRLCNVAESYPEILEDELS